MAGIKITNLVSLTVPASDDLLYIVDVSDLTDSPEGTSKKIEVGDIIVNGDYQPALTLSANITCGSGCTRNATYSVAGKTMTLGVSILSYQCDYTSTSDANILIDLPTGYDCINVHGAVSSKYNTAPSTAATITHANGVSGGTGKVQILLQNYGTYSDVYDFQATFVIQLV
jgi:hypothetical protein